MLRAAQVQQGGADAASGPRPPTACSAIAGMAPGLLRLACTAWFCRARVHACDRVEVAGRRCDDVPCRRLPDGWLMRGGARMGLAAWALKMRWSHACEEWAEDARRRDAGTARRQKPVDLPNRRAVDQAAVVRHVGYAHKSGNRLHLGGSGNTNPCRERWGTMCVLEPAGARCRPLCNRGGPPWTAIGGWLEFCFI